MRSVVISQQFRNHSNLVGHSLIVQAEKNDAPMLAFLAIDHFTKIAVIRYNNPIFSNGLIQ